MRKDPGLLRALRRVTGESIETLLARGFAEIPIDELTGLPPARQGTLDFYMVFPDGSPQLSEGELMQLAVDA